MTVTSIAALVFMVVLLPIGLGLAVHRYAPALSQLLAEPISRIAGVGVLMFLGTLMVLAAPAMWTFIGNGAVLAIIAFVLVGLTIGHFLGGPTPANRTALRFSMVSVTPIGDPDRQRQLSGETLAMAAALVPAGQHGCYGCLRPVTRRRQHVLISVSLMIEDRSMTIHVVIEWAALESRSRQLQISLPP
jgi:hypothetical protein